MKVHLVVEMELGTDPVSAARVFSELPKVMGVMSVVDEQPFEIWQGGLHMATEHDHPLVKRWMAAQEERARIADDINRAGGVGG